MLIRPATLTDAADIAALLDGTFGPARHARTASLLRIGATPVAGPSLVARAVDGGTVGGLLGSIQFWPIALVADARVVPLTLLGPLAVATPGIGIGRALLAESLDIADRAGLDPVLLIGDLSYYGPFGFTADATGGWTLPGPVERERLLLRRRGGAALPVAAHVVAADSVSGAAGAMVRADG